MLKILLARLAQGHRTSRFLDVDPILPDRFRGRPTVDPTRCPDGCAACIAACPTGAIASDEARGLALDLGRCLFCPDCVEACPEGAIDYTTDYRLAARRRDELFARPPGSPATPRELALGGELRKLFGRSLKLRQVSAGGCNGCEADVNVLGTVVFDLGRFGIQFVASPRHADGLLITGPVTANMQLALRKAYDAVPDPKIVIAVGACAISGGPYADHPEVNNGADAVVPVDLYIPGCPPHPYTILEGLVGLLGRTRSTREAATLAADPQREVLERGIQRAESELRSVGVDLGRTAAANRAPRRPEDPSE
jgi:Ni,Fe-hydrogenase III small subunit/Pyruvate/2-oxoacid:ferredoxin oxidoreductase delta subunit